MATGDIKGLIEDGSGNYTEVSALQASSAEMNAGTENGKVATPKNMKDAEFIAIHVGTSPPADTTKLWLDTN